ncbi:MAG: LLM class flavin-dependent oxidoreductase [Planctomycetes bacterium]|nr:LLM class flavin-dependent oxidoreductase [Planctomycetota bacterium]
MEFDIFFSISRTPVAGALPSEAQMFRNFFEQVVAADVLGFGVAWVAESHLSTEVQKRNRRPVVPHWQGEVGLNVDLPQLAQRVWSITERIEVGAAVMNIVCNGGPVAAAERIAACCALHGWDPEERRRLHVGFSAGRFEFMNRAYGIDARDPVEVAAWPALKGKIFREAATIFLRLLRGDALSSDDSVETTMSRKDFRSDEDWHAVRAAYEQMHGEPAPASISIAPRWNFEELKVIPEDWRRELCVPIVGSHDPVLQEELNKILPVQVFNLSITKPEVIEATHQRMAEAFHPVGGSWKRSYMPRTVFVFLNDEEGLSADQQSSAARAEADSALGEYWRALEGTIDPNKVSGAANNALIGNPDEVAEQIRDRFHAEDRLMLWFDFFNHDSKRVIRNMRAFMEKVAPQIGATGGGV